MLTSAKKALFKKLLLENLEELSKETERGPVMDYIKDENADPIDRASEELNVSLDFRFRERDSRLVQKIKEALERLEDGSFGVCEECEEEISEKRLIARPIATLCIKCKEKQEKREKIYGT